MSLRSWSKVFLILAFVHLGTVVVMKLINVTENDYFHHSYLLTFLLLSGYYLLDIIHNIKLNRNKH
ncbi:MULTISPECIES: hypothetical protein [Pontibacillus]|uniref:Uncharacterized protein n=1 Tax=Pontibacillus chungwhensis TaxID=265426 RepID=A0ABY8V4G0_9BACI|nr:MULTISPECIES: hypothetical protein [Pontibacillus]MCD5322181.1 hypothetical protein [Pontibacillus sp. HN14]WIF99474.1 hypothetical protein QNI29_07405 [Pontibacillus chungwhensis]